MFSNPVKNLKAFGLKENDIVADLGAGTGYYSIPAGYLVPKGKVYAIEIVQDFLETIRYKVKEAHLNNVEVIRGNVEKLGGTKIGDIIADAIVVSNILFEIEDKEQFILELRRILKKGGKVLLIDWRGESAYFEFKLSIPEDKALQMFEKKGFTLERKIDAGEHHYGMILIKQ